MVDNVEVPGIVLGNLVLCSQLDDALIHGLQLGVCHALGVVCALGSNASIAKGFAQYLGSTACMRGW